MRFERREDPARDRGQRGQPLVLHRQFRAAQDRLGDVAQDQHAAVRFAVLVQQRLSRRAGVEVRAVEPVGHEFGAGRFAAQQRLAHPAQHRHVGLRAGELARVRADDVLARRAACAQERVVGVDDLGRIVGGLAENRNRDAFGRRFHRGVQRIQPLVHLARIGLEPAAQLELVHHDVGDGAQPGALIGGQRVRMVVADGDRSDGDAGRRDQRRGGIEHEVRHPGDAWFGVTCLFLANRGSSRASGISKISLLSIAYDVNDRRTASRRRPSRRSAL